MKKYQLSIEFPVCYCLSHMIVIIMAILVVVIVIVITNLIKKPNSVVVCPRCEWWVKMDQAMTAAYSCENQNAKIKVGDQTRGRWSASMTTGGHHHSPSGHPSSCKHKRAKQTISWPIIICVCAVVVWGHQHLEMVVVTNTTKRSCQQQTKKKKETLWHWKDLIIIAGHSSWWWHWWVDLVVIKSPPHLFIHSFLLCN